MKRRSFFKLLLATVLYPFVPVKARPVYRPELVDDDFHRSLSRIEGEVFRDQARELRARRLLRWPRQ